jgi:hypothetical protein
MSMPSQRRDGSLLIALLFLLILGLNAAYPRPDAGRSGKPATNPDETPVVKVSHLEEEGDWYVAETANFRLYHQQTRGSAEELLRIAERTRADQQRKWFGAVGADWEPKCRICWYPNAEAYGEATGVPSRVNGHTQMSLEGERVISRWVHLHGSQDILLPGVLPHEVTHAVLAGRFGGQRVPRWADEGMAILAETRPRVELHLRQLPRCRAEELLYPMRKLVQMREYPEPRGMCPFYAQSVSLVEFLSREKGTKKFADFVRDGERDGYEDSLRRHYGWDFAELDRRWQRYAFPTEKPSDTASGEGG